VGPYRVVKALPKLTYKVEQSGQNEARRSERGTPLLEPKRCGAGLSMRQSYPGWWTGLGSPGLPSTREEASSFESSSSLPHPEPEPTREMGTPFEEEDPSPNDEEEAPAGPPTL